MVMTVTVEPGFASFSLKACSSAFKSSGLKMAGKKQNGLPYLPVSWHPARHSACRELAWQVQ